RGCRGRFNPASPARACWSSTGASTTCISRSRSSLPTRSTVSSEATPPRTIETRRSTDMRRAPMMVVALAATALALAACSAPAPGEEPAEDSIQITAPLSGQLGDKSFMDSANAGLERAAEELGVTVKVVEAGADDA